MSDPGGEGADEALGDPFGTGLEGTGQEEDGIDAAHLGVEGNRLGTRVGDIKEGAPSCERSGEGGRGDAGLAHEPATGRRGAALDQGKDALGHARACRGPLDGTCRDLAGAGMGGMGFDDNGTAGGKGRDRVGAEHGDGNGEIARPEDGDRADRFE